jgi:branched-chain amino acid transport system substrate-binding protein
LWMKGKKCLVVAGLVVLAMVCLLISACGGEEATTTAGPATTVAQTETTDASTETTAAQAEVPKEVVIGYNTARTGGVGPFGSMMEPGVDWALKKFGGTVTLGGQEVPVRLVKLDNKSDPTISGDNAKKLFLKENAAVVLQAISPPVDAPAEIVAEQLQRPMLVLCDPPRSTMVSFPDGMNWTWIYMFDEKDQTLAVYEAANLIETNKKVAICVDTETDGQAMAGWWEEHAAAQGLEVVVRGDFQPMTTDFSSFINEAQAKGAEILVGCMIPPDGIALCKQMKAMNWIPKFINIEKASDESLFAELGDLGYGICDTAGVAGYRPNDGDIPYMFEQWNAMDPEKNTDITSISFDMASFGYAGMYIALWAIEKAGSLDPKAINDAIATFDQDIAFGAIKKSPEGNFFPLPCAVTQHMGVTSAPLIHGPEEIMSQAVPLESPPPGWVK